MERDSLASRLRDLRVRAGISQQRLGLRLNRPQSYVSKIENAERRVELHEIEEWADATGHTLCWTFVAREAVADDERAATGAADDAELVASVTWLLDRLDASERALLQSTVGHLLDRIGKDRRQGG